MGSRMKSLVGALSLAAACLTAAPLEAAPLVASMELEPKTPQAGGLLLVTVRVEGLRNARLAELRLDPGLSLETSTIRARVDPATGRRDAELRLEIRIDAPGAHLVESLVLEGEEGRASLGPRSFTALPPGGTVTGQPDWRWVAPESAWRYGVIVVRLEMPGGAVPASGARAFFDTPRGLVFEAGGQPLSWLVSPLESGRLSLPEAQVEEGGRSRRVVARRLEVRELPAAASASRAVGSFALSLTGPGRAAAGEEILLRLELSGTGNFPLLRPPELLISLDGKTIPAADRPTATLERYRPGPKGYEGSILLETRVRARMPGRLEVTTKPWTAVDAEGAIRSLETTALAIAVGPRGSGERPAREATLAAVAREAALSLAAAVRAAADSPALLEAGDRSGLAGLLGRLSPLDRTRTDAGILAAAASYPVEGERAAALVRVYGLARSRFFDRHARRAAFAFAEAQDAGPPLLDQLPPPLLPALSALGAAAACLLPLLGRRRGTATRDIADRRAAPRRATRPRQIVALCLGILALALGGLAIAGAVERGRDYALAWSDRALTVPSLLSSGGFEIREGRTGEIFGRAPGYAGLRFADGSAGWLVLERVYPY